MVGDTDCSTSWWHRKHICVILANHLHIERSCQSAVGHLVDDILQNASAPTITFGVPFSVLHCVLVRVRKDDAGAVSVACTDALEFLPDFCGNFPHTPGTEALCCLGIMPALDDVQFFHSVLRSIRFAILIPRPSTETTTDDSSAVRIALEPGSNQGMAAPATMAHTRKSLLHLPVELILSIAEYLCHPCDLNAFAVTCTTLMAACLPLVRLPQVFDIIRVTQRYQRSSEDAPEEAYFPRFAGFILYEYCAERTPAKNDIEEDLFTGDYWTVHDGRKVLLTIGPFVNHHIDRSNWRLPSGLDFPYLESATRWGSMFLHYGHTVDRAYFERKEVGVALLFDAFYWRR